MGFGFVSACIRAGLREAHFFEVSVVNLPRLGATCGQTLGSIPPRPWPFRTSSREGAHGGQQRQTLATRSSRATTSSGYTCPTSAAIPTLQIWARRRRKSQSAPWTVFQGRGGGRVAVPRSSGGRLEPCLYSAPPPSKRRGSTNTQIAHTEGQPMSEWC